MRKTDTNSIRYPSNVDEKLEKLSQGFARSKKELFCQMVDYFYRSKKDPADWGDEILKKQLSSGINRILSFIRQQEKDFHLPLFTDSGIIKTSVVKQVQLSEAIGKHLIAEGEKTKIITKHSDEILKVLKMIASKQKEKQALKENFSHILEYYITQREEMGWTTSGIKKDELITHVRKSLQNL